MDVKDIRPESVTPDAAPADRVSTEKSTAAAVAAPRVDSDKVSVSDTAAHTDPRAKLNQVISIINVASEATAELEKLVHSLSGILEQVGSPAELPDNRRAALEGEAQQLAQAIREQLNKAAPGGKRPLAGDPIRVQLEERLGKTLDVMLPDHSGDNLGITAIHFSTKEAILQTKATVEAAAARLEALRKTVTQTQEQLRATTAALDVGIQNGEAARSSVRDVDAALKLASDARTEIGENPDEALGSVGKLEKHAQTLLQPT